MAFTSLLRQRALPLAGMTAVLALYPKSFTYADAPPVDIVREIRTRKPIYDHSSQPSIRAIAATTPPPASGLTTTIQPPAASSDLNNNAIIAASGTPTLTSRTPTARLALQIRRTRLLAHQYTSVLESHLNTTLSQLFSLERNVTHTLYSLAPPKESNEHLLPSSIYILVAGLGGNILTRNRNILLRATVPLAAGLVTANWVLPRTMGHLGQVVWRWEQRFPIVAGNHQRFQEGLRGMWEQGTRHAGMGMDAVTSRVGGVREGMEEWVRKGR